MGCTRNKVVVLSFYASHQTITLYGKTSSMFPRGQEPLGVNCKILCSVTPLLPLLKWGKVFLHPASPVHISQVLKCLHLHWEQHSSFKKIAGGREVPECRSRRWLGVKASGSLGSSHTLVKGCLFIIASISHRRVTTPSSYGCLLRTAFITLCSVQIQCSHISMCGLNQVLSRDLIS